MEGQQCSENVATHTTIDQKSDPSPGGKVLTTIDAEMQVDNAENPTDSLANTVNKRKNENSTNEDDLCKKIKTEHDYDLTSNGLDVKDSLTTNQTSNRESGFDTQIDLNDNKVLTKSFIENQLEIRNRNLKERLLEDIMEHYFLGNDWKLNEYYSWKKRVQHQLLSLIVNDIIHWCENFKLTSRAHLLIKYLDPNLSDERISDLYHSSLHTSLTPSSTLNSQSSSNANSTIVSNHFLKEPLRLTDAKVNSPISATSSRVNSSSLVSLATPLTNSSISEKVSALDRKLSITLEESNIGTNEQIVEAAKQEAYVMKRIADLRKNGVWSIKRLPKVQEPPRNKVHWDYLLEEMQWLAVDFLQERKWKKNAAKKCSKMITKYHSTKEFQAERIEKEEQTKMKRIASNIAKLVKQFWSEIEKVIETKQEVQLNEKRKKIQDMQLRFIVDKADHFTEKLAQELVVPSVKNSTVPSVASDSETIDSRKDFEPNTDEETDVEVTISKEDDERDLNEIELLKKESEIPLEELANSLPQEFIASITSQKRPSDDMDDDCEFEVGSTISEDNEETIDIEEANDSIDNTNEINDLENEANIPIDQLLSNYGYVKAETDDEVTTNTDETENNEADSDDTGDNANSENNIGLKFLISDMDSEDKDGSKRDLSDIAAGAESIQPKGNTLSSVEVQTKVPFLLKFQLREYQHIGLDWLVAMYEKNLNGILADEMGLGKTIQTISLIAHLACERGIWGQHLIVVPTSVMLNWEMEFKKWCPALKILTYYGSPKERRLKRKGWTKPNTFHVCITSYKLVVQDHQSFRRKKWVYLILDEAQHIKNFKSQRWQMLLNFNSTRRLLLTGTPLQNNLLELWSLMHFLMPNVFQSHREFKDWFVNPVTGMIEGNNDYNDELIRRLHKVLRPFLLRRLKCDVEKQLPKKYEHIIHCQLSKRQRFLYDEFMSQGTTKETLSTGSFLSVINILMQLRKVCNHPNLFDPRPTISPFIDDGITYNIPSLVTNVLDYQPLSEIDLRSLNLVFSHLSYKSYIQEKTIASYCDANIISRCWDVGDKVVYARLKDLQGFRKNVINPVKFITLFPNYNSKPAPAFDQMRPKTSLVTSTNPNIKIVNKLDLRTAFPENSNTNILRSLNLMNKSTSAVTPKIEPKPEIIKVNDEIKIDNSENSSHFVDDKMEELSAEKLDRLAFINKRRCYNFTIYPSNMIESFNLNQYKHLSSNWDNEDFGGYCPSSFQKGDGKTLSYLAQISATNSFSHSTKYLPELISTPETIAASLTNIFSRFLCIVPNVIALPPKFAVSHAVSYKINKEVFSDNLTQQLPSQFFDITRFPRIQRSFQLPELRLIQYDCGKLQILDKLLHQLKSGGHRVLIFTQMSRMLDIFEQFLNYHGHIYLRLDGSTKIEQRHMLMERFNNDPRFFCFILSTRSGGVGVNLTGADTVIFYDSDWNPTMDAQAQDRCHRIGQTKDVHIYRIISERTIEENILKKAQQKKLLGDLAIEGGNFTTAFFKETAIKELFDVDQNEKTNSTTIIRELTETPSYEPNSDNLNLEHALFTAEDETDVAAVKVVRAEVDAEFDEFDENIPIEEITEDKSPEEEQIEQLISQLIPVERYALKFAESSRDFQELKQAEEEIEEAKKQWQKSMDEWKMTTLNDDEQRKQIIDEYRDSIMTCSRQDGTKVFISLDGHEPMPVWSPPTPPQDENDLYIDYSLGFLYEKTLMPESQLPLIYLPKDHKRLRIDSAISGRKRSAMPSASSAVVSSSSGHLSPSLIGPQTNKSSRRLDDLFTISKSPFDRSTSIISRFRRELLLMKLKLWPGNINFISPIQKTLIHLSSPVIPPSNITSQQSLAKSNHNFNSNIFPRWLVHEEFAIIKVLMYFQDLPFNLSIICPGHIPNWDFVAEQVNSFNCIKRSAKFCKFHFESVMAAKDDRMNSLDPDKTPNQSPITKQGKSTKKNKNQLQSVLTQQSNFMSLANYSPSTSQMNSAPPQSSGANSSTTKGSLSSSNHISSTTQPLVRISNILQSMVNDNNMEFTKQMNSRFDAIKTIVIKKTQTSKSRFKKMPPKVFDHVSLLQNEYGINYDKPLSVEKVAMNRAERILKEKQAREQAARAQSVRDISDFQQQPFSKPQLQQQQPQLKQIFQATTSTPVGNHGQFHSSPSQPASNVAVNIQQSQPTPQVLLSQVPVSANSSTFISAQQLQHVLTSKVSPKLQNVPASSDSLTTSSDQSTVALGSKLINSHVVSIQSSSPNVHHVTLSQAQSLGLISSLQQSPDGSPNAASALQQHLQQQTSSQTGQFVQSNQASQQIPVNVSITNQSQIQHKLFAAIAAGGNVNVTHANQNMSQNAQVNQIITSNQTLSRLTPQYKQLIFRQNPQQFRQQLTQPQTQLQVSSSFQVIPQSRHIHMQPIRTQNLAQAGSVTSTPTQRYQITSISGQGGHSVLSQSLISGGIKQIVTTASSINVSNSQPHSQIVGSNQRILASSSASGHAISSSITGSLIASNKATVVASGNNSIIARTIRPDNILASQILKQHSQIAVSNSPTISSTSNIVSAPTSQIFLQQHSQHLSHGPNDNSSQQPTSIPVSFVKNSGSSGTNISAIQISTCNSNTVSVPISSSLVSNTKLITQSLGNVTVVPSSLSTTSSSVPFTAIPGTQLRQVHLLQKRTQPSIQVSSTPASGQQVLTHKTIVQQSGTTHSVVVSSDGQHSSPSSSQSIVSPLLQSSNSLSKTSNMYHLVPASAVQQYQQQSIPITVTTKAVLSATPSVSVHQVHPAFKQGSIMMQTPTQQGSPLTAQVTGQSTNQLQTIKTCAGQSFISVSSIDSPTTMSANPTTIKLMPGSAIGLQQQASSSPGIATLSQTLTTPKGHIIISGHGASSIVGQSSTGIPSAASTSNISSSALLQQVVPNQTSAGNSGQTLTFEIRTSNSQQQSQQLNALSLKSRTAIQMHHGHNSLATCSAGQQQHSSALVAALAQPPHNTLQQNADKLNAAATSSSSTLLRTLATPSTNTPTKTIPIVLMQTSQNANLISQSTSPSLSLISNCSNNRTVNPSNKITTSTQTSGATLGSILSAAANADNSQFPAEKSKPSESTLIETLLSPISIPVSSKVTATPQSQIPNLDRQTECDK